MSLRTPLCGLLGIDVPIIQAPIGNRPELPLAVAAGGGLGMLQLTWTAPEEIPDLVTSVRGEQVALNLVLEWPQEERLELALEHGARIVSFFWGDPAPLVDRAHAAGALVLATIASAEEAKRVAAAGVDVVVAQGWEAGGHVWGDVATLPLVPAVVDAVELPVIAAGGIGDGRGVAAVLALGAQGAWLGTRFIATEEAHHLYKDRVLEALETDTVHTNVFSEGWPAPHRTLRNAASEAGAQRPASMPQNPDELETAALYSGQSAGLVHAIRPAAEVVQELAAEAEVALSGAGNEPAR